MSRQDDRIRRGAQADARVARILNAARARHAPPREQVTTGRLIDLWAGRRYTYADEKALHAALAAVLDDSDVGYVREQKITGGRVDFLVGTIAVEVKVAGSSAALLRQVTGYAADPGVSEVLVVTTRRTHTLPVTVSDKPVRVLSIGGLSL